MSPLPTLLRFCDFLENRVHTSSLGLFRRMLHDFFAGNEHTLLDFMRLGATVVAIFPIELKSQRKLHEAAQLLAHQRNEAAIRNGAYRDHHRNQQQLCVFQYLLARVATKNILWLRDLFQQFCRGEDTMLQEFIQRGNAVISVIPVDIQAIRELCRMMSPKMAMPTSYALAMSWTAPGMSPQVPSRSVLGKRPRNAEDTVSDVDEVGSKQTKRLKRQSSGVTQNCAVDTEMEESSSSEEEEQEVIPQPSMWFPKNEMAATIMQALERLEAQEPWKRVFNPGALPLPFSRAKHPNLAATLQSFWAKHARAVWERQFWAPLASMRDRRPSHNRKTRQSKTRNAFETVMHHASEELGPSFFAQLDQRKMPHKGWWYASPIQDLLSIAQRLGMAKCLRYIESQAFVRSPVAPGNGRRYMSSQNVKSSSMWSTSSILKPVLREICAIKAANKRSKENK